MLLETRIGLMVAQRIAAISIWSLGALQQSQLDQEPEKNADDDHIEDLSCDAPLDRIEDVKRIE